MIPSIEKDTKDKGLESISLSEFIKMVDKKDVAGILKIMVDEKDRWNHLMEEFKKKEAEKEISGMIDLSKADLSNKDLSGRVLSYVDMSGANLTNTNLSGSDLSKSKLGGASIINANLSSANLYKVDIYKASISQTDLHGANIYGVNFQNTYLTGSVNLFEAADPKGPGWYRSNNDSVPIGSTEYHMISPGRLEEVGKSDRSDSRYGY